MVRGTTSSTLWPSSQPGVPLRVTHCLRWRRHCPDLPAAGPWCSCHRCRWSAAARRRCGPWPPCCRSGGIDVTFWSGPGGHST
ncbi:unnamed protein product [Effrenium voratum]|uniref:Uncharacterized protein n=1 Tax=Effrenium voratum TaxID=2562239 RepID=A0AA36ITN3_9DINO|nr:unnamed protein product [Effrenium voratum]CAJ1433868.1 unnamed protein product [Effrenium voratum]